MEFLGQTITKEILPPGKNTTLIEIEEQIQLCAWIKKTYPGLFFMSDMSGLKLPMPLVVQGKKLRSHDRGTPDLFIASNPGLFIELKVTGHKLTMNKHEQEQEAVMQRLREQGYVAFFACGQEEAKKIIVKHLSPKV